jgi:hypothetical protein
MLARVLRGANFAVRGPVARVALARLAARRLLVFGIPRGYSMASSTMEPYKAMRHE